MIRGDNKERGYDSVKGGIGKSFDKIEDVAVFVSNNKQIANNCT